jgi:hypothetical protein
MKQASRPARADYREFVFTATGRETDIGSLDIIDVYDNLVVELDRLHTLAELLGGLNYELSEEVCHGAGLLVNDVERRMRTILGMALRTSRNRRPASSPAKE